MRRFDPEQVGWRIGRSSAPSGVDLWVPYDRTTGVYGPQGSGKTLDLLTPALLSAHGAALVTLTKPDDLILTLDHRAANERPVAVLDPFDLTPGVPQLVWDPVVGCVSTMTAERRAKAFTTGTVRAAVTRGGGDDAARFYAAEAAKVLQAYFHAAALTGRTLEHVLEWVADPHGATQPEEILRTHPHAGSFWDGLLRGALNGDDRTAGNTITTVQQAMALFFQEPIRRRCIPAADRRATDIADLIQRRGTIYLLGRDDPYASVSPLMTATAEHVLDTALQLARVSRYGRLCPSFLACLDELPSTTPLPTLQTRMANERAAGLSFIYAAQTFRQLVICYGEDEARALFALTNNIVVFGGGKDVSFYRDLSDLLGTARVARTTFNRGWKSDWGTSLSGEDVPVLRVEELRQLPDRHALVLAENAQPIIARLNRCIEGKAGRELLVAQERTRIRVSDSRTSSSSVAEEAEEAIRAAERLGLATTDQGTRNGQGTRNRADARQAAS
jgi:type IV secretion system protein VirD4